ncbi:hypothetical protein B4N89_03105 [Embleya scabrispora]|uniref:VCBS repeat-containing protein n=1 Tax=Embleya scabrispora TaxID=159449 RepID=A0A1T3NTQ6_9ACTN|nr:hypothetical protein [Embleya scabrispora]OPC80070.1 hypothetical protein B4N89_03105 [Embleya scabrispora]
MPMPRRKPIHNRRLTVLTGGIATAILASGLLAAPASAASTAIASPTNLRMQRAPINGSGDSCGFLGAIGSSSTLDLFATIGEPNGPLIGAHFEVHEVGNGNPTVWDGGWDSEWQGTHEAIARVPGAVLTNGKTYAWSVEAGLANQPDPARTVGCTFTYDDTRPGTPTITSTDFPVNGGGKYVGQEGVFIFDVGSAGPDLTGVEYALDTSLPVGGGRKAIYDAPSGTWRTPPLTFGQWGTNNLSAQTIDHAGNRSWTMTYTFFVPSNPNPPAPKPGDINRDGKVDILSVDAAGALRFHSAGDNPTAGGRIAAAANAGLAEDAGGHRTWAGTLTTHRGGDAADNLYAHANSSLGAYRNFPGPLPEDGFFLTKRKSVVVRPQTCVDPAAVDGTCTGYADSWSQVKQLVAAGDVDGVATGGSNASTRDLFTVETDAAGNAQLWLFSGTILPSSFDHATPIGPATRQNQDIMVPGDVTGDGLPELWIRDRTNGNVYQYASVRKADGTADLDAYTATPTLIGTGFDTTTYPKVSTDGDFDADGHADLWARTPNGNVHTFPGGNTPDPATGNTFGPAQLIAGN